MNEELQIIIKAVTDDVSKKLKDVQTEIDKTSKESSKLSKIGDAMKGVAKVAGTAFIAAGAAAAAGVAKLTKDAIDNYAEYEQLVGGVETLFKNSSAKVQQYADEAYQTAGMSANAYMQTVTSFSASLLQSLDGDTNKAAEAANQAVIDMADNANKMGTSVESIQNAYQGFAKQNYTMLDNLKLGYGGTKTEMERLLADASKLSGVKYDISNLNDVYSAIHVVQTELGITGTTAKEASSTIQGSAASMKAAWSNMITGLATDSGNFDKVIKNFVKTVGTTVKNILPVIKEVATKIPALIKEIVPQLAEIGTEIISTLLPIVAEVAVQLITAIVEVLPTIIEAIIGTIPTLIQALVDALPVVIDGIIQVVLMIAEHFSDIITPIIEALPDIIMAIVNGLINNLPALINGVIQLVLGVVAATGLIIKTLLPMIPDIFVAIVKAIIENIPTIIAGCLEVVVAIFGLVGDLVEGIIGYFKNGWKHISEMLGKVGGWINDNVIKPVSQFFSGLWDGIKKMFANVGNFFKEKFNSAVTAIKNVMSPIVNFFSGIWDKIKGIFSKVGATIGNAITNTVKTAVNGVLSVATKIINGFISAINVAIGVINAIPGVNIKKLDKLEVPKMAKGGIVDSATLAVVGEQGKEAIVPLENNTEWIDKLAEKINNRDADAPATPIVLNVDGKTFAQTSIAAINDLTKQTGRLGLTLM